MLLLRSPCGRQGDACHAQTTPIVSSIKFVLVDEVQTQVGGTATIFVKSGDEFVHVATNVKKDNGSRAIGTIFDPKGKAIAAIAKGKKLFRRPANVRRD